MHPDRQKTSNGGITMTSKACTIVLGLLATIAVFPAWAQDAIGVVKRSTGQVLIERGQALLKVAAGGELFKAGRVLTGAVGQISIIMRRVAWLTVGPVANVALDRYAPDAQPVVQRPVPPILQGIAS